MRIYSYSAIIFVWLDSSLQSRLITCIWIWISGERRRMEERSMHQVFESRYSRKVYYISRYRTVPSFFFWKSNERNRLIRKFNFPRKPQKLSKRDFLLINFIKTIRHLWTFQRSKKNSREIFLKEGGRKYTYIQLSWNVVTLDEPSM